MKEGGRRAYESSFNQHLLPVLASRQLRSVTAAELQLLVSGMQSKGRSTIGYVTSILRGVFGHAYASGVIDRDPTYALKKPPTAKKSRRALTGAETAAALKVGREHPEGLLLLLLYYTGATPV